MSEGNKDFTQVGGVIDLSQNRRGRVRIKDNNRLCFAYYDKNKTIRQAFHGDTYRLLRDIPIEFSIIDYLYRHEFNDFKAVIEEKLKETGWELLTDVTLRPPFFARKERDGKKKNGKKNGQKKNGTKK